MKYALMAACAVIVSAPVSHAQDLSQFFSSYIAFGDSLTDDGKFGPDGIFAPLGVVQGPPSDRGRFSNGETYAEIIAKDFSVDFNFALGGATARDENENPLPPGFGSFSQQVSTFSSILTDPGIAGAVGDRPLISVLFGGNDVLQNVGLPGDFDVVPDIGAQAAQAVETNIRAIKGIDDTFNDFVVINLPDVSQTPLFTNPRFGIEGNPLFGDNIPATLAAVASTEFNAQLALSIDALRDEGFNIIEFDLNAFNQVQLAEAVLEGINIVEPCTFNLSLDDGTSCADTVGGVDLSLADDFFFIDGVHPNRVAQAGTAAEFRSVVAAAVVPLPAGLPLLLTGIAFFGFLRMRRAA